MAKMNRPDIDFFFFFLNLITVNVGHHIFKKVVLSNCNKNHVNISTSTDSHESHDVTKILIMCLLLFL